MTDQELFDAVVTHLRKQGRRATNPCTRKCVYHAPDGTRCAAGSLIIDEHYYPDLEGRALTSAPVELALIESGLTSEQVHSELLGDLLHCHDENIPEDWEASFAYIAKRAGLNYGPAGA